MESTVFLEQVETLVKRVFIIEDVTLGGAQQNYLVRYRGRLRDGEDSAVLYDRLAEGIKPYQLTPLFRWEEDRHAIFIVPGMPMPKPSNPWINLVLFIATLISVLITGALYGMEEIPQSSGVMGWVTALITRGWPFAVSMIAILAAHEFGHYLVGRRHGVHVTLPYFIPMPLSAFGTMGAFINMKEPPKNRRVLLDIGIAGPLAGLFVAVPVLFIGLWLSRLNVLPLAAPADVQIQMEGNSILYLLSKFIVFGQLLPAPVDFGGMAPALYWLRYFFTGQPFPFGATDVLLDPVAWAGWAGLLVTALNLIPAGQLDGGHVLYTLFGRKFATRARYVILVLLVLLGLAWPGWWIWAALIFWLGRATAEPLDQITPLDTKRKILAGFLLLVFVLVFTPVPLIIL